MSETNLSNELLDTWATNPTGPVALTLRQRLLSVEGEDGEEQIIYPPTFADVGYNVDTLADGTRVALIDSVGSQANRLEPAFKSDSGHALAGFVPQIEIVIRTEPSGADGTNRKSQKKSKDEPEDLWQETRSLFELAHRAADAVVQSSPTLAPHVQAAFAELRKTGNAMPLATIAPTSLLFGCWDSRGGSGEKLPRLVRSIIRAWDVDELHSAAQFNSVWKQLDSNQQEELEVEAKKKKKKLSVIGFKDAPAVTYKDGRRVLGGIVVRDRIERNVTINLVALRNLVGADQSGTLALRKYLLGLSILTATTDIDLFLREGCNLRIADAKDDWKVVPRRGEKQPVDLNSDGSQKTVKEYLTAAYEPFEKAWQELNLGGVHVFDLKAAKALLSKASDEDNQES